MSISLKNKEKALSILESYNGNNNEIKRLRYNVQTKKNFTLNELNYEYILSNYENTEPILINRTVKITKWYGETLQKKYDIEFIPEKIKISHLIGETSLIYHCYVKWRGSQTEYVSLFIPKKAISEQLIEIDWENIDVDVDRLNKMLEKCGRKILPHQPTAIKFLLGVKKCILADDQGLGKTTELIAASILGNFNKILIISPAGLKTNWKKELSFFGIEDVSIISGVNREKWDFTSKYVIANFDIFSDLHKLPMVPDTETVINPETGKKEEKIKTKKKKNPKTGEIKEEIVYRKSRDRELIQKTLENNPLIQSNFDLIIIDEAHKLSNNTSQRYKSIEDYILKSKIQNVYLATGTPITNKALNYYNLLRLIQAEISNDYQYYIQQYCGAYQITKKDGKKIWIMGKKENNLDELRSKTQHLYLRRLKSEIPGLPEKSILEQYYDLTEDEQNEYDELWEEYENAQIELGKITIDELDSLQRDLIEGTLLRKYLAKIMVTRSIELAESHIEDGEKIIIGCCFDEEVELLKNHFGSMAVVYNGKMTSKQKDKAKDEFMENPKIKVFIGNINAAGVGLTLIAGTICIFNCFSWVPGDNLQFIDRIHRIGQTKDIIAYFQLFNNTHSERVWNGLIRKTLTIDSVIKEENEKV